MQSFFSVYAACQPRFLSLFCVLRRGCDLRGLPQLHQYGAVQRTFLSLVSGFFQADFFRPQKWFLFNRRRICPEHFSGSLLLVLCRFPYQEAGHKQAVFHGRSFDPHGSLSPMPFCGPQRLHVFQQHFNGRNRHFSVSSFLPLSPWICGWSYPDKLCRLLYPCFSADLNQKTDGRFSGHADDLHRHRFLFREKIPAGPGLPSSHRPVRPCRFRPSGLWL